MEISHAADVNLNRLLILQFLLYMQKKDIVWWSYLSN